MNPSRGATGFENFLYKIKNAPNIYTLWKYQNEVPYIEDKLKEVYKVNRFFEIKKEKE